MQVQHWNSACATAQRENKSVKFDSSAWGVSNVVLHNLAGGRFLGALFKRKRNCNTHRVACNVARRSSSGLGWLKKNFLHFRVTRVTALEDSFRVFGPLFCSFAHPDGSQPSCRVYSNGSRHRPCFLSHPLRKRPSGRTTFSGPHNQTPFSVTDLLCFLGTWTLCRGRGKYSQRKMSCGRGFLPV